MKMVSVLEYAEAHKISVQAVYKKMKTSLKDRVKRIDGKLFIELEEEENLQPIEEQVEETVEPEEQPEREEADNIGLSALILEKERLIAALEQGLKSKDEVITALQDRIASQEQQIDNLTRLAEQAQQLQRNQQLALVQVQQEQRRSLWQRIFRR